MGKLSKDAVQMLCTVWEITSKITVLLPLKISTTSIILITFFIVMVSLYLFIASKNHYINYLVQ